MRGRESKAWRATRSPSFSATQAVRRAAETARSTRGSPATGSDICRPASTAKTIWALRSIRYSLAWSFEWRADCFQSMARRSMPARNSTSASKSAPSPRCAWVSSPSRAWRWRSWAPRSCRGLKSGRIGKLCSASLRRWRQARPSGPRQRSQAVSIRPSPRRVAVTGSKAAPAPSSRGTIARPSSSTASKALTPSATAAERGGRAPSTWTVSVTSRVSPT